MLRTSKALILLLLLITFQNLFTQNLKFSSYKTTLQNRIFELTGNRIRLFIEENSGKYYFKTIENKNILYYDSTRYDYFTSHLNVKIDDSIYSNEPSIAKSAGTTVLTGEVKINADNASVNYKTKKGAIDITQKLTPVNYFGMGGTVIEMTITNNDITPHNIGLLMEFDIQVNKNDGAHFKTNLSTLDSAASFSGDNFPFFWRAYEKHLSDTNFIIQGNLKGTINCTNISEKEETIILTPPDLLILDEWEKLYNVLWDYSGSKIKLSDGGALLRWDQKTVEAGSSLTFRVFISESRGSFSNGKLIENCFTLDELSYNGKRYNPEPLFFYALIYNNSENIIKNITSSIELPYNITVDSATQIAYPVNIDSYCAGIIKYSLHPKMSAEHKNSIVKLDLFSDSENNSCNSIIRIPAAPDADTLNPSVLLNRTNCSFNTRISDSRKNDKGLDTIIISSIDNMDYTIGQYSKSDTIVTITGSIKTPNKPGKVHFKIFDISGNLTDLVIETKPDIIGFINEQVGAGNQISVPFRIISRDENRVDTVITCRVKYDPVYLKPESIPVEVQRDKSEEVILSDVVVENNELSFRLTSPKGFSTGVPALLQFIVQPNVKDSTILQIQELTLNNNPNYCVYASNSTISFNSVDKSAPQITLQQFGCRFSGTVIDNALNDKGIYKLFLSNSANAVLFAGKSEPGTNSIKAVISAVDSSLSMRGDLVAIDGSGNYSSYYFYIEPVLVKMHTINASSGDIVQFSPTIYGDLPDISLHQYEFGISYDTSILSCKHPYYNQSSVTGSDFKIICDTTEKGKIKISAAGVSFLTLGRVLNLIFEVKTGKDTTTSIRFDYFYLKNGLKGVHTRDGMLIRTNKDKTAPSIESFLNRNIINIIVKEENSYDTGIDSVVFSKTENISVKTIITSKEKHSYLLFPIDSTKYSFCETKAFDILGNCSSKTITVNPVAISFPDSITFLNDSASVPVYIKSTKDELINSFSFELKLDTSFFIIKDTIDIFPEKIARINYSLDKASSLLTISSDDCFHTDTLGSKLLSINLKANSNRRAVSELSFSNIIINHDSLFGYGTKAIVKKPFSDTTAPEISIKNWNCEYHITITDSKGIDTIKLGDRNNILDTLVFVSSFKKYDTTALIKVIPADYSKESGFNLTAIDSLGNISAKSSYTKPVNISLPAKTRISGGSISFVPVTINKSDKDVISEFSIIISYDTNILIPEDNFITYEKYLSGSVTAELLSPKLLKISAKNIVQLTTDTLFILNLKGIEGDSLVSEILIDSLSINKDSICSYSTNGITFRNRTNSIVVSIEPTNKGQIGKETVIPIHISGDYKKYRFSDIAIHLSFNASLLKPTGVVTPNSGLETFNSSFSYNSGKLILSFTGDGYISEKNPLTAITANVLLGNSDSSTIKIDSFIYNHTNNASTPEIIFEDGIFIISGKFEWQEGLKLQSDYLYQNHPNPYNASTTIQFTLLNSGRVSLIIYDILGREILRPVDDYLENGNHQISIKSNNLPSGVYYYHLKTNSYSKIRKMVLLK